MFWGAMDQEKLGRKYKKHIVVRPSRFREGLFELYTYHFPKTWSAACVANRELQAQAAQTLNAKDSSGTPEARLRHLAEDITFGPVYPSTPRREYMRSFARGLRLPLTATAHSDPSWPSPSRRCLFPLYALP